MKFVAFVVFGSILHINHSVLPHSRITLNKQHAIETHHSYHRRRRREISLSTGSFIDPAISDDYFYAILNIGEPQPQRVEMALDTGSALPYFACQSTCIKCGNHDDAPYNISKSKSFEWIHCQHELCGSFCDNDAKCKWSTRYVDGSSISALVGSDLISFFDRPYSSFHNESKIRLVFGCSEMEANTIYRQNAGGVMGLSMSSTSFVNQIFNQNDNENVFGEKQFAHCFGQNNGLLLFGSKEIDDTMATFGINIAWTPFITGNIGHGWYRVNTVGFKVESNIKSVSVDYVSSLTSGYHGTVIDTGSSTLSMPTDPARQIRNAILQLMHSNNTFEWVMDRTKNYDYFLGWNGKIAFTFEEWNIFVSDYMMYFPDIVMLWNDENQNEQSLEFRIPPDKYLLFKWPHICLDLFDDTPSVLVGSNVMMDKLMVYDIQHKRLGLYDMNCDSLMDDHNEFITTVEIASELPQNTRIMDNNNNTMKNIIYEKIIPSMAMNATSAAKSSVKSYIVIYFMILMLLLCLHCTYKIYKLKNDSMRYHQMMEINQYDDIVANNQIIITNIETTHDAL